MAPRKKRNVSMSTNPRGNNSNKNLLNGKQNKNITEQKTGRNVDCQAVQQKIIEKQKELEERKFQVEHSKVDAALNDAYANSLIHLLRRSASSNRKRNKSEDKKPNMRIIKMNKNENNLSPFANGLKNERFTKETLKVSFTKREMQEQLEGVSELLRRLGNNNPDLRQNICKIAQTIPKMKMFQVSRLFTNDTTDSEKPTCSRYDKNLHLNNNTPKRREDSDSRYYLKETNNDVQQENQLSPSKKRKNRREIKKSYASEQIEFVKYINSILAEYFGNNSDHAKSLEFTCGEDIESYAQRLVGEGIGRIVEDEIRVNHKNNRQAFVSMNTARSSNIRDGMIPLPVARLYAFDGDTVRAFVFNPSTAEATENVIAKSKMDYESITADDSIDDDDTNESDSITNNISDNSPKAFVIAITQQTNLRQVVGSISFKNPVQLNDNEYYYTLKPHDMRMPMIFIPKKKCEEHINANAREICGMLFVSQVIETDEDGHCIGELLQPVGRVGDVEAETRAILLHNGLNDTKPYEQRFDEMFASPCEAMDDEDLIGREDLRKCCIFTIDPLTARDLDDAMSIDTIGDNEYQVGVHISDVSYYLLEDTELDDIVKNRATTIYLVNEVIHMLPKPLCFKCSLLPGEEKFAFSVFWRMNSNGEVLGEPRFTRSVIKSCTQFAYEHAQKIINNPNEKFGINDFPTILNGFSAADIISRMLILHKMAVKMRDRRYENGALSLNNPKIRFSIDSRTGEPMKYEVDKRYEANFLIEEFMLLANQSVAKFIYESFPEIAFLRYHEPPLAKAMKSLCDKLQSLGVILQYETSKALQESITRVTEAAEDPEAMELGVITLLTKPMARAKYFCSGANSDVPMSHYALSVPIYTHFTSPIRRYPDVLVHRILAAALNYCPQPKRSTEELQDLASICNRQKFNAKCAGEDSTMLFFKRYLKAKKSIDMQCVVIELFRGNMNVVGIECGYNINVIFKKQKVEVDTSNAPSFVLITEKNSSVPPIKLKLLSRVNVSVYLQNNKLHGFFVSPDKQQRRLNRAQSFNTRKHFNDSRQLASTSQPQSEQSQRISISEQRNIGKNING